MNVVSQDMEMHRVAKSVYLMIYCIKKMSRKLITVTIQTLSLKKTFLFYLKDKRELEFLGAN